MSTAILEPHATGPSPQNLKAARRQSRKSGLFDPQLMKTAFRQSLVMLRPDIQWANPVMFVVEVGTVMTVTLTADHRAVDGAMAARFLQTLKGLLEEPASMLV